jgi:hypothetical protein
MRVIYTNTCSLIWAETETETETNCRLTVVMGLCYAVGCGFRWISIDTVELACTRLIKCCVVSVTGMDLDCMLHGNIRRTYTVRVGLRPFFLFNQVLYSRPDV